MFNTLQSTLSPAWWHIISNKELPEAALRSIRTILEASKNCAFLDRNPLTTSAVSLKRFCFFIVDSNDILPAYALASITNKATEAVNAGAMNGEYKFRVRLPRIAFMALSSIGGYPPFLIANKHLIKDADGDHWLTNYDIRNYATAIPYNDRVLYMLCANCCEPQHAASSRGHTYFYNCTSAPFIAAYQRTLSEALGAFYSNTPFHEIGAGGCLSVTNDSVERVWNEGGCTYILTKGGLLYTGINCNALVSVNTELNVGTRLYDTKDFLTDVMLKTHLNDVSAQRALSKVASKYPEKNEQLSISATEHVYIKPVATAGVYTAVQSDVIEVSKPRVRTTIYKLT